MSIKSRLRQWLSDESDAEVSESWAPDDKRWYAPVTLSSVSPQTALGIDTAYACVDRYAKELSTCPLQVYERLKSGGNSLAYSHNLYYLLHDSPNEELTAVEYWDTVIRHILTYGNSISRVYVNGRNDVTDIQLLMPWKVEVKRDKDTGVRYYLHHKDGGAEPEILYDGDVMHIPGPGFDGLMGYSPIEMNRRTFESAYYAEDYTTRFLANNGIPPAYLSFPGTLSEKSFESLRKWIAKYFNRLSAGSPQVLDRGMEIKTVAINHRDLQWIDLRRLQVEQICRIYDVPPHRVQDLSRSTNNNIEHQDIEWTKHSIRPLAKRIEARVNKSLFGSIEGNRFFAEFNLNAMYRGDMISEANAASIKISSAQMSPNEARRLRNENPYEGGDTYWIQGAMMPVDRLINPPEPPPATAPVADPADAEDENAPADDAEDSTEDQPTEEAA
jgi:HK97 family phage portal protein